MFEHVLLFLSFIYAIAITHLFSSTTELILARDRVGRPGLLIGRRWMRVSRSPDEGAGGQLAGGSPIWPACGIGP